MQPFISYVHALHWQKARGALVFRNWMTVFSICLATFPFSNDATLSGIIPISVALHLIAGTEIDCWVWHWLVMFQREQSFSGVSLGRLCWLTGRVFRQPGKSVCPQCQWTHSGLSVCVVFGVEKSIGLSLAVGQRIFCMLKLELCRLISHVTNQSGFNIFMSYNRRLHA